jgi:hypothetical protein
VPGKNVWLTATHQNPNPSFLFHCYSHPWNDARHYPRVCKLTTPPKKYGKLTIQDGMRAIVACPGDDGRYPVYVVTNSDGEIEKLEIVFEPIM